MSAHSNAQILSAVLAKWGQPIVATFTSGKLSRIPLLANVEAKIKSTGWVSPNWTLMQDVMPLLGGISSQMIEPIIANYLKGIPDEMIPTLAHTIVDNGITNGGISLFEDNIELEVEDLEELKKLLKWNLPIVASESYEVKECEPISQG
jgi:hypothetical protein